MALLKSEPFAAVRSLDELYALAHGMECEAVHRYGDLAETMRAQGSGRLEALFLQLAAEEGRHVDSVERLSVKETGHAPEPSLVRWLPPRTLDTEGMGLTDPVLLGEYRALSVAVRNEERAFAFWSYVAAQAESADVQRAAERMAHAELEHVALLRRERRRAFHAERRERAGAAAPATEALERRLAEECDRRAKGETAAVLTQIATEARRIADELALVELPPPEGEATAWAEIVGDPLALAEALVDRYLDAADRAGDEAVVARAQVFAQAAIRRLAWLRSNLPPSGSAQAGT